MSGNEELYNDFINRMKEENKKKYKEYYYSHKHNYCNTIICECGGTYNTYNKSRHFRTKKHLNFIENNFIN